MYEDNGHIKADTSPYAYMGYVDDPYNVGNGGRVVDDYNNYEVEDWCDDPDSIFGLGNKKKKAERKLKKAEKKLAKGNYKAAARKIGKANKILTGISDAQQQELQATDTLSVVNQQQGAIAKSLEAAQAESNPTLAPTSLSTQAMSNTGSSTGLSGGGGGYMPEISSNTGIESTASDEPTGRLADTKQMPGVTVFGGKSGNILIVLIVAVVLIGAMVYFSKKRSR